MTMWVNCKNINLPWHVIKNNNLKFKLGCVFSHWSLQECVSMLSHSCIGWPCPRGPRRGSLTRFRNDPTTAGLENTSHFCTPTFLPWTKLKIDDLNYKKFVDNLTHLKSENHFCTFFSNRTLDFRWVKIINRVLGFRRPRPYKSII